MSAKTISMDGKYKYKNGIASRVLCTDAPGMWPVISISQSGCVYFHSLYGACGGVEDFSLVEVGKWDHIPIDARVLVRSSEDGPLRKRYFAGVNAAGNPTAWGDGATSWSTSLPAIEWDFCEVAE